MRTILLIVSIINIFWFSYLFGEQLFAMKQYLSELCMHVLEFLSAGDVRWVRRGA